MVLPYAARSSLLFPLQLHAMLSYKARIPLALDERQDALVSMSNTTREAHASALAWYRPRLSTRARSKPPTAICRPQWAPHPPTSPASGPPRPRSSRSGHCSSLLIFTTASLSTPPLKIATGRRGLNSSFIFLSTSHARFQLRLEVGSPCTLACAS